MITKKSFNVDEVANELGVSRRTIERMIQSREINSFKAREARRIDAEEVLRVKKKDSQNTAS